ncbi:MAG: hypothetical protein MJ061_05055, partial [Mailhella sp.]|nr:hypothetical protein [Mailhella sp.]
MSITASPSVRLLQGISKNLSNILAVFGGTAALLLLTLVCVNAFGRLADFPVRGAVESCGLLGALTGTMALPFAQFGGHHPLGGVMADRLPFIMRHGLYLLSHALCCAFFLFCAYEVYDTALFALEMGEEVDGVGAAYP